MSNAADNLFDQIYKKYLLSNLRRYQGNLVATLDLVEKKCLPNLDDPQTQAWIATLQEFIHHDSGSKEEDTFLLSVGLTIPGMHRGIQPPLMVLEENRGGFDKRRQGQAAGWISRLNEVLSLGRCFLPQLPDDTQAALTQLNEIASVAGSTSDDFWFNSYRQITDDQLARLADAAFGLLGNDEEEVRDIGTDILRDVVCFRGQPLSEPTLQRLIDLQVFYPSCLYFNASDTIAIQLIDLLSQDTESISHNVVLLAVAWTRSNASEEAFRQWQVESPAWSDEVYLPPVDYLPYAGWSLDESNQKYDLVDWQCFRLTTEKKSNSTPVPCRESAHDQCPSCGSQLRWLFDFSSLSHEQGARLFTGHRAHAPRKFLFCQICATWEVFFVRYFPDNTFELLNAVEEREVEEYGDPYTCYLADEPSSPLAACEAFVLKDASSVGGMPSWLQDAEFPHCVECGRIMKFFGQIDNSSQNGEGIYYAFYCEDCQISAVNYQQT